MRSVLKDNKLKISVTHLQWHHLGSFTMIRQNYLLGQGDFLKRALLKRNFFSHISNTSKYVTTLYILCGKQLARYSEKTDNSIFVQQEEEKQNIMKYLGTNDDDDDDGCIFFSKEVLQDMKLKRNSKIIKDDEESTSEDGNMLSNDYAKSIKIEVIIFFIQNFYQC